MKTKAYKLREQIARYIYKRISPYTRNLVITYNCKLGWGLVDVSHGDRIIVPISKVKDIEDMFCIKIYAPCGMIDPVIWSKQKEEKWKKRQTVKCPNKTEEHYLVETDTDVFGLYTNLDEAMTLKMHLEIVLGKKVYVKIIN